MDDEGYFTHISQYGKDGPVFSRRCTECGRWLKMPETVRFCEEKGVHPETRATCSHCGEVSPLILGWAHDFR